MGRKGVIPIPPPTKRALFTDLSTVSSSPIGPSRITSFPSLNSLKRISVPYPPGTFLTVTPICELISSKNENRECSEHFRIIFLFLQG